MSRKDESRITVRLDSNTNQSLDEIAQTRGQNRAATVRDLINEASRKNK